MSGIWHNGGKSVLQQREVTMPVRNRLSELLVERKMTLAELQKKVGRVDMRTLKRWQDNQIDRADFPILEKLCKALDCKPGDLIVLDED
jgi:putative transcriptional regulator